MELGVITYKKEEYVETSSGNKIFKAAALCGTQNIVINGKSIIMKDVMLRGDLCAIRAGKYCIIGERTIVRPSYKKFSKGNSFFPVHIGDHVLIEEDCVILAAQISAYVHIGKNVVVGKSCVIKECCRVVDGSVLAPDSVFPPFSLIAGSPARVVGSTPECTQELMVEATRQFYDKYLNEGSAPTHIM